MSVTKVKVRTVSGVFEHEFTDEVEVEQFTTHGFVSFQSPSQLVTYNLSQLIGYELTRQN